MKNSDVSRTNTRSPLLSAGRFLKRNCGEGTPPPLKQGRGAVTARSLSQCSTAEARALLPYDQARKFCVLPLGIFLEDGSEVLTVAGTFVHPIDLIPALKFATGKESKLIPAQRELLLKAIDIAYLGDQKRLESAVLAAKERPTTVLSAPVRPNLHDSDGDSAKLLSTLIDYAISREASDIHIVPLHDGSHVRMRVKGELYTHTSAFCGAARHQQLMTRLKVLAALDVTLRHKPQDGEFTVPHGNDKVFVRLSIMPTVHGEKAVIRLLNPAGILTLDQLGLDEAGRALLERHAEQSEGAILFAGATGSGKTTTLYALLQHLAQQNLSVATVEDPVEIQLPEISQTSVDERAGLTYAACLKAVLRQDPDVILIGEIRDEDSARQALQAALTGHLMLSTVHARSAIEVFLRLHALNADMLTVAQAVSLVVCQQLIPTLCEHCKVIDLAVSQRLQCDAMQAVGCSQCDYSGYGGRVLATEMIEMHPELYRILVHKNLKDLQVDALQSRSVLQMRRIIEKHVREGRVQADDI